MCLNPKRHRLLGCQLPLHKIQIYPVSMTAEAGEFWHRHQEILPPRFSCLTKHDRPKRQEPRLVLVENGSRDEFTFRLNEIDARNINNFNGLYDVIVAETELKALLAYLTAGSPNLSFTIKRRQRTRGMKNWG